MVSWLIRLFKRFFLFVFVVFLLPAGFALGWWSLKDRPSGWRSANWESAGILPTASSDQPAAIYVMAARTGGIKGALSMHSWIVTKEKGASGYNRYDKLGWGQPVRRNAYSADGRWYSNQPEIVFELHGRQAELLIPDIEAAIASYPYSNLGGYKIWPGPNSNSFIAHVLNRVPELGLALPSNAVGRDFLADGRWYLIDRDRKNMIVNWAGLFGFAVGERNGFEIHFMGLVAGVDVSNPALKVPGFGHVGLPEVRSAVAFAANSD